MREGDPRRPRGRPRVLVGERGENLTIRVPTELRVRAQHLADEIGVDLSEWIRDAMENALMRKE